MISQGEPFQIRAKKSKCLLNLFLFPDMYPASPGRADENQLRLTRITLLEHLAHLIAPAWRAARIGVRLWLPAGRRPPPGVRCRAYAWDLSGGTTRAAA